MKFQIRGTRKDNGRPAIATIEAATRVEAERKAATKLLIRSVEAIDDPAPSPTDDIASPEMAVEAALIESENGDSPSLDAVDGFPQSVAPSSLPYETPPAIAQQMRDDRHPIILPEYKDILVGNRWLRFLASIVAGLGWACIGLGLLILVVALLGSGSSRSTSPFQASEPILFALVPAIAVMSYGLICIITSAGIRLACGIGMAVRDMARLAAR